MNYRACQHHGNSFAVLPASFILPHEPDSITAPHERSMIEAHRPNFDSFIRHSFREWPTCPHGDYAKGHYVHGALSYELIPDRQHKQIVAYWRCHCGGGWYE